MNEFYFDLQRFDEYTITAGDSTSTATLSSGTHTITVTNTDSSTISYSITVNGGASVSADTDGTIKLSVTSGTVSNLIYSSGTTSTNIPAVNLLSGAGTFQTYQRQQVTLGTQKFPFIFNSEGENSTLTPGPNTLKVTQESENSETTVNATASNTVTNIYRIEFTCGDFYYINESPSSSLNLDLNIDANSNYSFSISPPSSNTEEIKRIRYDLTNEKWLSLTNGTITLGKDSTGVYVSSLDKGDTFSSYIRANGERTNEVTYKMGTTISATRLNSSTGEKEPKFYGGNDLSKVYLSDLDFDISTELHPALAIDYDESTHYGTLTISSSVIGQFTDNDNSLTVVSNDDDYTYAYGTLNKLTETSFLLDQSEQHDKYAAITIEGNYTVAFSKTITDATITVANTTTFSVTDTTENYSLTSDNSPLSVGGGATGLSLTKGTLLTSTAAQTIAAGDYSVYGYNDSVNNNDGITIGLSNGNVVVGDLDTGETLSVYDTTAKATSNYTMLSAGLGLLKKTDDTYTIYRDISSGGSHTLGSAGDLVIAPDSGTLEIGTTNTQSGVVYNSESNPVSLYAGLTKDDSGNYTLNTVSGAVADLTGWANTISLTGSNTYTIHENFAGENVTIATKNSKTTFKVTATGSSKTFTVNSGTVDSPTITGATAITLLSGSITVTGTPTITLDGFTNKDLKVTTNSGSGMTVNVKDSTATINAKKGDKFTIGSDTFTVGSDTGMTITVTDTSMTINAYGGDSFTVGGEKYAVNDGDGITFAVGSSGSVSTISDLATEGDSFTRAGTGYSVGGAGFIMGTLPSCSIWSDTTNNTHSLINNSVEATSLTVSSNWLGVTVVKDKSISISPNSSISGLLIDEKFTNTYGTLTKQDSGYTLKKSSSDDEPLSNISIISSSDFNLTVDKDFSGINIFAPNTSLSVDEADTTNDYQVTLTSGKTGLLNAKKATLTKGTLVADSNISNGVVVDEANVIPGEEITLTTDDNGANASIDGLDPAEQITVNSQSYTFTKAGLRKGNALLRGTKANPKTDENPIALSSITNDYAPWIPMFNVSTGNGVTIGSDTSASLLLVDNFSDSTQPQSLYGELKTVNGGFALATVDYYDAWDKDNYTINIDNKTVTISSGFEGANITASQAGAKFKVDSLDDSATEFVVTDTKAGTGATLSGAKAITQTDGLIAVASSGIQSVTVGEYTIANSGNLSLDVSASGGNAATLSSLDEGENFNINSTGYSIISGLGLRTDDQFFKESSLTSSFKSATLSELATLTDTNEWIYIAAIKDNILTVPPTIDSSANEWLVLDDTKKTRYGTLTSVTGGLSLTKSTLDTAWGNDTIQVVDNTLSLSSDFSGKTISGKSSGAVFTVSDNSSYSVIDATGGASIGNATNINLSAGTVSLSSATQTISGGDSVVSGTGKDVKLTVTNGKATVSALATGDSFKVEDVTYTLLSNGRLQRSSDNSIWNGSTIKTDDSGSIAVASLGSNTWNGAISTDSAGNLTIDSAATAVLNTISSATAFIVKGDAPTSIYGSFTKDNDTYKLSTSGINTGATLPAVTITEDVGKLNFTKDLVNVPITAGSTTFTATKASSGYTVNYDSSELSVDDATAIDLTTGTLAIKNSTQLVTANNQSVQAVSEAVNVTYDSEGVTVDGIATAGESVKINDNTYTLANDTTGDGISVNINSNGTTTIKDITVGDKFKIDDETFLYTSAGLTKTEANSDKISYVLKAIHPTSGELTLADLQSTAEDTWLGIYLADSGNVTISSDIKNSVVLVDSVTNPTTNYGQVKLSNGTYTLNKYSGNDAALAAIADKIQNPTSITVEKDITAVIDSVFSSSTTSIPVKANNATSITVTDSSGKSYVVGGTVDKFIPASMTFTPAENDEFTIDGTTYVNTVAGLTKGNKIWTKANVTDYVLPDDDAWSAVVKLNTDNVLDFTKVTPEAGSNIVVDNSSSTRWATLDYTAATDTTPATYSLKYIDSDKLPAVQLADGTATFTINYETTITTGNGTYTINDNDYTGSGLVVATTASTSTLQDGTVTLDSTKQAVTPTNDSAISVTSGEITATASNGKWDTLNNLVEGDTFKIGDNTYKVYGTDTLAKLNSSGEPEKIYNSYITNSKLDYSKIVGDDYSAVVQLNSDDQLDLTKKLSVTSAIVVGQKDGTIDPTVRVAQIDYSEDNDAYTLSETTDGVISTLKGVLLGTAVKSFNTTLETTVITDGIDTFTVNGNDFAALDTLTIATASNNGAFLTNGKVTVAEGATVTTRYTDTSNHDSTITSTTGILTVIADSENKKVTITEMDAGDVFNVGTNSYTMTSVGLTNGTKLNYNALKNSGITTAEFDLTDDAWKNIVSTDNGVLTINNAVGSNVFVADVDTENPSSAFKYGTITKSSDDGIYTLTQADGNDTALEGIILNGVKVTFPTTCTNTNITAKSATFKVTASEPFTIDAASTTLSMSDEVTAVELTSGTLQATNGIPITASGNVITTTSGTMTVGIDDTGVFVGGLNEDETFTVGNTSYKKTAAGLLDVTNQKLRAAVTDTYYIGTSFDRIIEAPNGALDLSNEKQSAEVYDSISNPTTHMATLTVADNILTLTSVDGGIDTITLAKDANLTVKFAATVNGSGATTVNSVSYDGTNLVIDATATSSTLQSGTVTIDSGESVKATKDSTALAVTDGSITATAADGKFTNIASLASGDIFTFNNKTYTKTAIGLVSSDNKLNDDVSTEVTVADLSGTAWQTIYQATSGALTINSSTGSDVVVVDIADDKAQCKRYGTLTKSGATYTLAQEDTDSQLASITLDGVKASLPTTCANTTITANDATFIVTASEVFTVNATSDIPTLSKVTAITLTGGTIQALNNIPITVGENVITTTSGTMTVGIDSTGVFVGGLNEDETFTVDSTSYKKTAAGLLDVTNQKLRAAVTDTYYIGTSFDRIIEAPNGALDLSDETQSAEVYDSISNPTTHMASLTASGRKLTLDEVDGGINTITLADGTNLTVKFAATVNASGNITVNTVSYDGTDLVIDATATNSTLQSGTVTIDSGESVQATKDSTALAVTDGSITATAANGKFTNIASLASGDVFTFNSKTYTQTAIGLVSSDNKLNEDVSTEVTVANLSGTAWQDIHQATNGALTINTSTGSDVLVVDIADDKAQSKRYGTLTKSGGIYTLAQEDTDSQLASITLDGVKASLPTTCANTTITANDATFTVTASELFTVDATSDIPVLSKVTAINLTDGTIQTLNNTPITIGDNVITTTSGTMTVGVDNTGVFVGGLNEDETFTVDGTPYKKTAAGLLDVNNQKLRAAVTDTYYIGASFDRIIEAPSGALDLSSETTSAEVYDSISNPATHMATLKVSGGKLTLNEVDGGIDTITLAKDATLTVDFAATVNSSGNTTVNSVSYDGTDLVIDATATSSTLQSGTVTIDSGESVKATKDSTPLAVTSGSITATAANGRFTNIASLASGDIFTFNSKTYTQTAIGLVSSDNKLNEDVSTEVTVANLSGTAWQDIHQATNGALTINTSTGSNAIVVDITDDKAQCKRYGTLTKSGVTYTLTQENTDSQLASITLDGVKASLPTTCANTTITANDATFTVTASELFTVDATSDIPTLSNVTAITLTGGTIQAVNNIPITVGDNVITTTSGTMTVGVDNTGVFVGGLNEDETFTVDGTPYKMTSAGLLDVNNKKLRAAVTDTYYIGASFDRIIEAPSGALDLSSETTSAEVYDSISNPATHMATLKVSGGKLTLSKVDGGINEITLAKDATLTVDFEATVNASGTTTVNGNTYAGTTDLVIDATATSSTLQSGTITIDSNGSIKATKDRTALAVTSGSITATAANGRFTNIASLASGDIFTFNSKTYTQTAIGLVSSDNKLNEDVSTEVTVANLSGTAWQDIHQATSGALTINNSTGSNVLVVDITDDKTQCKRYGTLTKSGVNYTLEQESTDSQLANITLDGVKTSLPTTCANTTITANDATFTVTASEVFTVDATSDIPVLSKVTAITLTDGTIQAVNNIPITVGENVITTTSGAMTVGMDSTGVFVGGLNEDETFTVDGTPYKMTSAGLLDVNNKKLRAAVTDTYYIGASFDRIIEAPSGALDLSSETTSAEVYDSISNPATHMATLTVGGGKLTLNKVDGGISTITLAKDANLTVDFEATVNSSGTTTVNGNTYAGTTDLVIDATATSSTLQSGTVTIDSGESVQTTNKNSTALAVTDGSITATAANGKFTNIASLASGDIFTFNSKTYTQTAIGLVSSDNKINEEVSTEVTIANLSGTAWQDIHQATSGALTINNSTGSNVVVVDITNDKAQCKRYGTLTKSGGTYTLAQEDTDPKLASITLDSVKANLPTTCADTTITANAATFTVTASELFTVDATSDIPVLSKVTEVTLNSGTIQALNNTPITIGDNVITTASGAMTVGMDSTGVFVGGLNEDETFTVDGTTYKMTATGLLDVTNQKLRAAVTDTYYIGASFDRIIEAPSGALDLSSETTSAEVYDSISNPATHMATLTVGGGKLTLNKVDGGISTITLAKDANLTVDFEATVNSSGTTTVNGNTYAGTTDLVIDATATSSTLQSGTVTIDSGESVQTTNKNSTALAVTDGSITATAANGKFTTLTNVDAGDQFSFNDNSYIQSTLGLIKDSTISAELVTPTITIKNLDSAKWLDFIAPSGGVLNLTNATVNALVLDSATAPTTKLADLTISNSRFNLKGANNPTAIEAVTLPENSNISVDFATQVYSPAGSVTVNSTTFDAASEVIIDSDGSTATLYEGTVNLDTNKPTVKATNDSSALKVLRGSLTATVFDGLLVSLGELDTKDSFSFNDVTYTKTALGLMKDDLISENLAGSTIELADIETATWNDIIVPLNQTLDLTSATNALVCDDATNPTVKFATFTNSDGTLTLLDDGNAAEQIKSVDIAADTTLTVDFVTQVNTPSGSVTVNSKSYNGTSELVIQSDGTTSTLTSGSVTLDKGDSVATTNGNTISVSDGDGLTVNVGNNVTIDGINIGDTFKVDDNSYKVTESGLINTSGKFWTGSDFTDGLTVDALNLATNWTGIVVAKDGVLSVDSSTLANDETSTVVDDLNNPTITYGTLTKADDVYTLTKDADNTLSNIKVDSVKIDIDNNLAGVPLTITTPDGVKTSLNVTASAKFSNFTVDATGDNPTVDDVNAIEISAGKIELFDGQTITLAEDAQEVAIFAGNGTFNVGDETFTIAELGDDTLVEFDFDTDGNANSVIGFDKDSTVTIDDTTYTAPENNAILHYTEEDNWYFDGFAYEDYTVTVDTNGNVLVAPGVKFSNVIASGKTLSDDGKIKFAADYNKTPVTIVNQGKVALNINDADDNTLAENLSKHKNVTFNADGVETEDLTAVAGATFKLQDTKSLTAGDTKVTANDNDCEIGIGEDGTSISADKDATINAPADISLTLNAGDYNVNGADFTGSGTTAATTTADGVELDLATSDSIIYDSMTLSSAGTATIDNADGVTVSGGAKVTNATNRALMVDGTAYLDDKTINTAKATEVTTSSAGVRVNRRNVRVSGDTDGYTVNIANLDIIGLENIGNSEGVTVDGLKNATIKTDKSGSLTTGNKTFIYNNDSVTYGLDNGSIVSISDAEQIIGDFSDRVSVNGDGIRLTGSTEVTLSANKNGVTKLELSDEGTYNVNNKTYEIQDEGGFAFGMSGGAVTGVESVENGSLIISQNERGFGVNDAIVTLTSNSEPVTLGIVDSNIVSVSGVDGTINGLENATVYGLSNATINNKPFKVSGSDEYDAIVADGVVNSIGGITDGAIISSAPNVTVTTAENGTFTFDTTEYKVNDTLDSSVDFTTDKDSHVIGINNFAGEVSGVLDGIESLNGNKFNISGAGEVSLTSDGDEIVSITGITTGTTINGDVADMHYILPEGKVTVNGIAYELEGDDNGALFVSNDGRALTGLDKDATLSVGAAGNYTINGTRFTVDAGDAFTVNRDGAYVIDPVNPPISEKSEADDILARGEKPVYVEPTTTGNQTVDLTGDNDLALIDSADANVSVQAGAGNDSVVVRHGAEVDVNLDENGSTLIIPTAGKVTLENYNGDNAKVQTFDYSDVSGAIKSNEIKFGDGVMTMGDAIVTYDTAATDTGSTTGKLINAHGKELAVGFTYQNGGLLDESTSNENYLMKGNYAENTSDTQKGGGSTILTGSGNDTILAGAGDYIDAGSGYNQIYLTDKNMRNSVPEGATIVMNEGAYDTVSNFAGGFSGDDDKILIKNLSELGFGYGAGDLVMSAGSGQITFDNLSGNDHYELKLTDGTNEYKAAVAKAESVMAVDDSNEAEIFYGNENGISFSEYTGAVEVNLNENAGSLNGSAVQYYGLNKVIGGAGDTSLIGAANTPNTLTAGTGNGSIWSNSGRDLMVGNTDAGKSGTTTFFYMPGDGRDTITNFDFMSGTTDINADKIQLDDASGVTDVFLNGNDVMIGINNGADDYLRLVDAKGKTFRFNDDLIAKVDDNVEFDGFTNCYVGIGNNSTLTIGEGMGDVGIWLSDDSLEYHGIWYDGNFAVLDASLANGNNTLAGNEFDNLIIGGVGENSIWGGYASSNDTLVGGSGQNTFFFALENGHDVIQNAHDGDLISLEDIYLENIARADITSGGAVIELTDGSRLEVQSSAAVDYRLQDGTTYTADRRTGEWVQQ